MLLDVLDLKGNKGNKLDMICSRRTSTLSGRSSENAVPQDYRATQIAVTEIATKQSRPSSRRAVFPPPARTTDLRTAMASALGHDNAIDAVATPPPPPVYTLHYFPFSLYSLMVRFGFALGAKLNPATAPRLDVRLVDLHREDHLSESYLTSVTTKGQVPALTSPALPAVLDDSRAIADWLCEQQPELLPPEHRTTIARLMDKMYSFHALPLAVSSTAGQYEYGIPNTAAARLEKSDLSEPYRRALEIKSVLHDTTQGKWLDPENVARVEALARDFMRELLDVLRMHQRGGTWIFGARPTILDAHATALAARLIDVERYDLLPDEAREYARGVMATPEWKEITHGRPTIRDTSWVQQELEP
ncbi:hypothetical protein G7046_g6223 [Stylonectria norvegica]|nr:hypothetical protein G7046_g6223 [Stylonectria norvegica]